MSLPTASDVEFQPSLAGEHFLPLPRPELLEPEIREGPITLYAAKGTPVHAVAAGRIVAVERELIGEIVTSVEGHGFHRYRRLHPRTLRHNVGDWVAAGTIIGRVGEAADERDKPPCLVLGLQGEDGRWLDVFQTLIGLPDPTELGLSTGERAPADAPARSRSSRSDTAVSGDEIIDSPSSDSEGDGPTDEMLAALVAKRRKRRP